jgi:hypothetical protein
VARGEWLRLGLLCGAFWSVVFGFAARGHGRAAGLRLLAGLAAGALLAHLGWALLHPGLVVAEPGLLADVGRGHAVLFVPFGLLLAAPRRRRPAERTRFLAAALPALLPGLAVARLGCLAAGCCGGRGAVASEALLLLAVGGLLPRLRPARRAGLALGGIGAARLLVEPWRTPAPFAPLVPVWLLAAGWLAAGLSLLVRRAHGARSPRPADPVLGSAP